MSNSRRLVAAAAAAAAVGLLITPAQAQARPEFECYKQAAGYQFPGGEFVIHYPETDAETRFNAPKGLTVDAPAETFYENGTSLKGRVTGKIEKGGNIIRMTVTRGPKYAPLIIDGAVDFDNAASGSFAWENHDRQLWDSPTQLACVPGAPIEERPAPAPAPAPAPEPVAAQQPAPAPQEAPAPAPQEAPAPAPQDVEAPAPEQNQPCIPDPFELNFPGAC